MKIIKKIMVIASMLFISSCSIFDTKEQTEIISEKSCKETCLMRSKSYQGYDKKIGCFCGIN